MISLVLWLKFFYKQDADKTLGCLSKEGPFKGLWYALVAYALVLNIAHMHLVLYLKHSRNDKFLS